MGQFMVQKEESRNARGKNGKYREFVDKYVDIVDKVGKNFIKSRKSTGNA
jgi:hypothetical protein